MEGTPCSVVGCERPRQTRGWCRMHYKRWQRHGDPLGGGPPRQSFSSVNDRFWAKVDRSGGAGACWPWLGVRNNYGYGKFTWLAIQRTPITASRVAYFLTHGRWPKVVRHRCDNPPCCNPAHLVGGRQRDNIRDAIERGRWQAGMRALTAEEVREIRARLADGDRNAVLASDFRVSPSAISLIRTGRTYRNVT